MKTYHLIAHDDSVRPGKATTEQIAAALNRSQSYEDRLGTVSIVDGEIVTTPLTVAEIDELRGQLAAIRRDHLVEALDAVLRVRRLIENVEGASAYSSLTIYVEQAPHAEDIVRDWAASRQLVVEDKPLPASGKTWIRTMDVKLHDKSWSPTVVALQWPSQRIDGPSIVARDAELDGRTADAETARADPEAMAF